MTLKLALTQYQITWMQHGAMAVCLLIWWPMSWLAADSMWIGSYAGTYVLDYTGLFAIVQAEPCYWLLLLLVPAATLMPQLYLNCYQRTFYPEFRDLAMEAEFWKLDPTQLEKWKIRARCGRLARCQSRLNRWRVGGRVLLASGGEVQCRTIRPSVR